MHRSQRRRDPEAVKQQGCVPGTGNKFAPKPDSIQELLFREGDTQQPTPQTIQDFDISEILGTDVIIAAKLQVPKDYGNLVPNYVASLIQDDLPRHLETYQVPSPGGTMDDDIYRKLIRALEGSPESTADSRGSASMYDDSGGGELAKAAGQLRVPASLHKSALAVAEKNNRHLLLMLHHRRRDLAQDKAYFNREFPSQEASLAHHAEEVADLSRMMKLMQQQPSYNAMFEVGIVEREPYVQVALVDKELSAFNRKHNKKYHTRIVSLDRNDGDTAVWLEKAPPARVFNQEVSLRLQVCESEITLARVAAGSFSGDEEVPELAQVPLEAAVAHAKKLASTVVGQVQRDIKEMELATIPTELSFQLEQNPKAEKSGCFASCFGSCKGSPAKEGRNGSDDGEEADWDSPVRVPSRRLPAGVLQVVVRFFQERFSSLDLLYEAKPTAAQGQSSAPEPAPHANPQDASAVFRAQQPEGSDKSDNILGGAAPCGDVGQGSSADAGVTAVSDVILDAHASFARQAAPSEMESEERDLDRIMALIWDKWDRSRGVRGINDAEVIDERHRLMIGKGHTFYLDEGVRRTNDAGIAVNDASCVSYAAGDFIFPEVPGVLRHLVKDADLDGIVPDKSWWAMVQLVCNMGRVRKQRRDLAVLCMLMHEWHGKYAYLRAVRGLFQHLVTHARKGRLTWRELVLLRGCNHKICTETAWLFEQGPSTLLPMQFEEAIATFQEMQKLLLLCTDGDEATWEDEINNIMLALMGRGAVKRLSDGLPDNPTDDEYAKSLVRHVYRCTEEMRVDKTLTFASLGKVNIAAYGAYVRYGTIKGQLEAMIEAFGRPAEDRHSAFAYTPVMQLLEDTLYQHHYALRDQDLVDTSRQLHDPQGVGPPVALVDVEELFEPAILDWVIGLRESVLEWAGNTLKMDKEVEGPRVVNGLNSSLLELLKSAQEVLEKISRRAMRASEQARRFRVGQVLTDLFEESMQKYSESLSKEFMVDLESNAAALLPWVLRSVGQNTSGTAKDPPLLLTKEGLVKINSLWLVLSNQHRVEENIQQSFLKGLPYVAMRLDVNNFDLESAKNVIEEMKEGQLGARDKDAVEDGDVSEVSESLSWYEEDKTSVLASVNLMMDKVQLAQHSISNMVLMMVIGVAKSLAGVVSAFLEGLLYKAGRCRPEPRRVQASLASKLQEAPEEDLELLSDVLSRELQTLIATLNDSAFSLVLETSWHALLQVLEAGLLHTTSTWIITSHRERLMVVSVLDALVNVWHGGGEGLPSAVIDQTTQRLRTLLKLHGSATAELSEECQRLMQPGSLLADMSAELIAHADTTEHLQNAETHLAFQNVTAFTTHMKSMSLQPVSLLDITRLLRQRQGDSAAEKTIKDIAAFAASSMKELLGLGSSEEVLGTYKSVKAANETTPRMLVISTNHIVLTDLFAIPDKEAFHTQALQAISYMVKGTARTAVSIVPKQGQDLLATAVRALPTGLNLLTSVVGTAVGTAASVVPEQGRDLIHMAVSTVTPKQGRELVRRSLLALSWQGGDRPPKPGTMTEVIPPEHIMDLQQSGNELKLETKFGNVKTLQFTMAAEAKSAEEQIRGVIPKPIKKHLFDKIPVQVRTALRALSSQANVKFMAKCHVTRQLFFPPSYGDLYVSDGGLVFVAGQEQIAIRMSEVASVRISDGTAFVAFDGVGVTVHTAPGKSHSFKGMNPQDAQDIGFFIQSKLG